MFGKVFSKAKNQQSTAPAKDNSLRKMINSAGRVSLTLIQSIVQTVGQDDFLQFMQKPVLAGSAIHQGNIGSVREMSAREMNRTVLF